MTHHQNITGLDDCPHAVIARTCTRCLETTCAVCGTVDPNGGLLRHGANLVCAYRFGCTPGVQRPQNG